MINKKKQSSHKQFPNMLHRDYISVVHLIFFNNLFFFFENVKINKTSSFDFFENFGNEKTCPILVFSNSK
jgi:hypothetical protein